MASTTILKVTIVNGSAKIRTGGPGDERKDTERQDLLRNVWTVSSILGRNEEMISGHFLPDIVLSLYVN